MDNQAPLAAQITESAHPADRKISRMAGRRGTPASGRDDSQPAAQDWQPGSGLVKRMLAYSDWWNIPSTRPRGSSRA